MPSTDKWLLVDGHNLLFQMFYGMPSRITNRQGQLIQAIVGFVGALGKMLRMIAPTHVAVLFDGEHPNARVEVDAQYKANRPSYADASPEENPFAQLPTIYAALDVMGICHTEVQDVETDDVIGAYAHHLPARTELVIASFDSDFFQLITPCVTVLRYRGEKSVLCDMSYIRTRYGIQPAQYADFKCLTGDHADNIPGVPGIGPKTAAALLTAYGNLDGIMAQVDHLPRPSWRQALHDHGQRLMRNRALIRLEGDAHLPFEPSQMVYKGMPMPTRSILEQIHVW